MAYFYVKNGGTATGDGGRYASAKTGSWATAFTGVTEYYNDIDDACSTPTTDPATGDYIFVSDVHSHSQAISADIGVSAATTGHLYIMCVDDDDVEVLSSGASEEVTSNLDMNIQNSTYISGMTLKAQDDLTLEGDNVVFDNCTLNGGDEALDVLFKGFVDGKSARVINSVVNKGSAGNVLGARASQALIYENTTFTDASVSPTALFNSGMGLGGGKIKLTGCDMSSIDCDPLIDMFVSSGSDDSMEIDIRRCKLHASTSLITLLPTSLECEVLITNTAATSSVTEYQYFYATYGGYIEDATNIYRNGSTAFPSGQKISLVSVTDSRANIGLPFISNFPTRYAELSSTASDTLRIYILSSTALTDQDVWAVVTYPDSANQHTPNTAFSVTAPRDPFRTPTTLTTNTEAWTGRTTENRYQIDLDTSGDVGADCVPVILLYVAKASATIYFCPTLGLS